MTTLYVSHPSALDHAMPEGHPERADRIRAVERALEDERFAGLVRGQAPKAEPSVPTLVHPVPYVQALIEAAPTEGYVQIDGDTLHVARHHRGGPARRSAAPCTRSMP